MDNQRIVCHGHMVSPSQPLIRAHGAHFLSETLQLFIGACLSNNERKTESGCAAVNITVE